MSTSNPFEKLNVKREVEEEEEQEFKTFSAYQIFTILNLNKRAIQKLENYIFPNKIAYPAEYAQI